jgi:hypothetical protein
MPKGGTRGLSKIKKTQTKKRLKTGARKSMITRQVKKSRKKNK